MRFSAITAAAALSFLPAIAFAQNPVAKAFRETEAESKKNLIAALEDIPAAKYAYKPTKAQMSVADIADHLSQGNDYLCGAIGGSKAAARAKISPASGKPALVARLKETFAFCDQALAGLDDSKLGEEMSFFGRKMSRAGFIIATASDWADHYSQLANYMRLNGMLPPTAKKPSM
jgi:uncharacterized damage-inducible protein DinB